MNKIIVGLVLSLAATGALAQAEIATLNTAHENNIGLMVSAYAYKEPSVDVLLNGTNIGIEYLGTYTFNNNVFILGEFDYNTSNTKYTGWVQSESGDKVASLMETGIDQYYYNLKSAIGYKYSFNSLAFTPYIGFGYRYLTTKCGKFIGDYDRQSNYHYVPLGVINTLAVNHHQATIASTLEYDYLLSGYQFSGLSAVPGYYNDTVNKQNSGYGINLSILYKQDNWGIGPYWKYWHIKKSNLASAFLQISPTYVSHLFVVEPKNHTNEFGIKLILVF